VQMRERKKIQAMLSIEERERRIQVCNLALKHFLPDLKGISLRYHRGMRVAWATKDLTLREEKMWVTRGNDFFPLWHRQLGCGGTACHALASLVFWCRGQPTLSVSTWRCWAGARYGLCSEVVADILEAGGFPKVAKCVLCGIELLKGHDWWSLDEVKGPCCHGHEGCRQRVS